MTPFPGKIVVGITGGIACGKSTVCKKFETYGWQAISTDSCSHYILENNDDIKHQIFTRFGDTIKDANGSVDKSKLGGVVFKSSKDRAWLEHLMHPLVRSHWMSLVDNSKNNKIVVEVPLLFENNLHALFTKTICVYSSEDVQCSRLIERGMKISEIESRMKIQIKTSEKAERANYVILTDGELDSTYQQIDQFLKYFN